MVSAVNPEVNKILSRMYYEPNILEEYDNVTYNIRFYMIPAVYQEMLSNRRAQGLAGKNQVKIDDKYKLIIAETGVTSNYDITSLTIKSTNDMIKENQMFSTTFDMFMRINEVNGCSLINKITAVSKFVGYEQGYTQQPYHVDIWFTGYEHSTGKPVKIINNEILSYEVIINEVKTTNTLNGMTYEFSLTPTNSGVVDKSMTMVFNVGQFKPKSTIKETIVDLEEALNKRYFEANKFLKKYYDKIEIKGDAYKPTIIHFDKIQMINFKTKENNNSNKKIYDYQIVDVGDVALDESASPSYWDRFIGWLHRTDETQTIEDYVKNICFAANEPVKTCIPKIVYKTYPIQNIDGAELYYIIADIVFLPNDYQEYFQKRREESEGVAIYSTLDNARETNRIYDMQLNAIKNIINSGALKKRYEWMYNGRDTSVLDITTKLDKLWYANIDTISYLNVEEQSNDNVKRANTYDSYLNGQSIAEKYAYFDKKSGDKAEFLETVAKITTAPLDGVRGLAADGRLYVDDIYYSMDNIEREKLLQHRPIDERYNPLNNQEPQSNDTNTSPSSMTAKVGYENVYSSGNLVEIRLKILGDPYWLGLYTDDKVHPTSDDKTAEAEYAMFRNIAVRVNTAIDQKQDGTYDLENCVEFSNIYKVVEITSLLEGGKFTQELFGVINESFMHAARLNI